MLQPDPGEYLVQRTPDVGLMLASCWADVADNYTQLSVSGEVEIETLVTRVNRQWANTKPDLARYLLVESVAVIRSLDFKGTVPGENNKKKSVVLFWLLNKTI